MKMKSNRLTWLQTCLKVTGHYLETVVRKSFMHQDTEFRIIKTMMLYMSFMHQHLDD